MRKVVVIKDIPEEVMLANNILKQALETVHDIKSKKIKSWKLIQT